MRLLIVALSDSIHTVRWISQILDQGWDIHLFPSVDYGFDHPEFRNVTIYHSFFGKRAPKRNCVKQKGYCLKNNRLAGFVIKLQNEFFPNYRINQLKKLIKRLKPDIVHSIEFQKAAYLTLEAKDVFQGQFPPWIVTNWGSDLFLFGRLDGHEEKILRILKESGYYSSECHRDVKLARDYGFEGVVLPVFPNAGGFDLDKTATFRKKGKTSERRLIMLKGYQGWAGRALAGLRALERLSDLLIGYEVVVYSAAEDVLIAAELFTKSTGIPTRIIANGSSHETIMRAHGKARISIGLSISDAISTSLLEAIVMGSFPIQSWTSCGNEWIEDGKTGILVPPEDPDIIEKAMRKALVNDDLVDSAALINWKLAQDKLDAKQLKKKAIAFYREVLE